MNITKVTLISMLSKASELMKESKDVLSEIDSRFGDGDHGITINKISDMINVSLSNWKEQSIKSYIESLGDSIMKINGGSAGPLWGTFIDGLSLPLSENIEDIDASKLKKMLQSALAEMKDITPAEVGDKTMMDALIPAIDTASRCSNDILTILNKAALAAEQGVKDTEKYIAKYGRAKNYKDQTLGTPDAGALSLSLFFKGLALGYKSKNCH